MTDNIAIVTDQWKEMGGAEHVAMEMSRTFDAPIYAGIVDEEQVPDDIIVEEVFTGWERQCMDSHYLVRDFFQMFGWQHVEELYRYDTIILNKNNPGWFIPQDEQVVVKYCHSTPRQPYDLFHQEGRTYISRVVKTPMRIWYWPNLAYPDAWICNSELVQRRLNRYWNRSLDDVEVVYPPTDTSTYGPEYGEDREYYFTFSRLTEHKRIDEIIRAFNQHPEKRLVIGGDGEERAALEALAGENVEFVGYLSEEEKRRRLAEC